MKFQDVGLMTLALCALLGSMSYAGGPSGGSSAAVLVKLTDKDQFSAANVTIHVGQTVHWSNASQSVHTVTDDPKLAAYASDASLPPGATAFSSGFLTPGMSYVHTFTLPGIYHYFCVPHESVGMVGIITVLPAGAPQTTPTVVSATFFPSHVYVTLQRTGAVEEFPEQRVWSGYPQAHYISSGPDGRVVLIGGFQNGDVYIANGTTGKKRATLHVGGLIQGVMVDPSGRYGLAIDASGSRVAVIDLTLMKIIHLISVGKTPHNAVFSKDGSVAYVTIQAGRALDVIDMKRFAIIRIIPLTQINGPHNVDRTSDGKTLWIRSYGAPDTAGEAAAVDVRNGRVKGVVKVGLYHGGIDIRPAGTFVFTTNIGGDTVDVVDPHTYQVVNRITVGAGPHGIRQSADGRWVYVSSTRANTLIVINAATRKIEETLPLKGVDPFWMTVVGNV